MSTIEEQIPVGAVCAPTAAVPSEIRADLRANLADGAAWSIMVGTGEAFLPAFALAVGMGEVQAGLVASVPMLAGALLQLASPSAIKRLGSHRRWVVLCSSLQAASFLPLVIFALRGAIAPALVFLIASIYWGCGLATGPAWNTWMEAIVPRRVRPRFFAARTRITQSGMVAGVLFGGVALQIGKAYEHPLWAFALLFSIACICRSMSACFLFRQREPTPHPSQLNGFELNSVLSRFRRGGGGGLLVYLLAVQMSVWLSGPYFTPYMLKKLHFSYWQFALLTAVAVLAKVFSLPYFGRYAQRFGTRQLLWIGGIGIVPVSGLWLVSDNFMYILALQAIGGIGWAAYELAMFLSFFETIEAKDRTNVLTMFNVGNATATVVGALVGFGLLKLLGETQAAFLTLFLISSFARLASLLLLARVSGVFPRAVPMAIRSLSAGPAVGAIDRPILPSIQDRLPQAATCSETVEPDEDDADPSVIPFPSTASTTRRVNVAGG